MTFAKRKKVYTPRICLSCGEEFKSEGPWNRICSNCAERNAGVARIEVRSILAVARVGFDAEEWEVRTAR